MEIKDTREEMNIPEGGIKLNEELIIVSRLNKGGSSYTYRAKKNDSEYVILKEYYPLGHGIYTRDKDGFLKYNDSLKESKKSEERMRVNEWIEAEIKIAEIAHKANESNSDCTFLHELVALEDGKTDSAFIEIRTASGRTLDEWFKELNTCEKRKKVVEMLEKICSVVGSLHTKKIIHCDLKPQNIYITEHDYVYVLDFGAAIYRSAGDNEKINSEARLGGISEGYSSPNIKKLSYDKSQDNIRMIDESDDIYSIIQILFYMLLGKTDDQIRLDTPIEKSLNEYVEELAGCHPEAQHLLRIHRLLENKGLLNMSNIQGCLDDLLDTEAMLTDKKTHFLSELINPETFHNLRSLLVLIGKITCEAKKSKADGKRSLVDSRDILVNGSLDSSDYTVTAASIKVIPGLDGTAHDEKDNVRKIRSLLREVIENSKEPICDGINCVGRRKLAKLLDDECYLSYDEFNNAIEELKNYSNPDLTYFETNTEEPIVRQSFDLISGDWDSVVNFLKSDMKSNIFHTNNYSAFINQFIEQLQAEENSIICVLKYDDNTDEMIERMPATIPYDKGYEVVSVVSDNLKIENDDNLYILIWGVSRNEEEIDELLIRKGGSLNNRKLRKKIKHIYVDDKLSSADNAFIYKNIDVEEIDINGTMSVLQCIEKQETYGISYDSIKYVIGSTEKDKAIIDELIRKQYVMLICGQVYISSRVSSYLSEKYEKKYSEDQSFEMLEKIFHYIVSKSTYDYNDELTILGILNLFKIMIKLEETEIESLINNVRYEFLYNDMNEIIINYAHVIYSSKNGFYVVEDNIRKHLRIKDDLDREKYILRTENNGCEEELDKIRIEMFRKSISLSYVRENFADKELKLKNSVIDICKDVLSKIINTKKNRKITLLIDMVCRLIFNNYSTRKLLPTYFDDAECVIKRYNNELETYDYKKEKEYNKANFEYLLNNIKVMLDCSDKNPQIRAKLYKLYIYTVISQFKLKENGLIENSNTNKKHYDLLIRLLEEVYECDIPAIEALKLIYYSWKELSSEELFRMILSKDLNKFHLINDMLMCISYDPKYTEMFLGRANLKVDFYNYIIDESNYLDYYMNMPIYVIHILMLAPVAHIKNIDEMEKLLSAAVECRDYIIEQILHKLDSRYDDLNGTNECLRTNIQSIFRSLLNLFKADYYFTIGNYKGSLECYLKIDRTDIWRDIFNLFEIPYINNYRYNIKDVGVYINFMRNKCHKILQMEEIVNIIGPDRFDMDNLDREDFVEAGKSLVDEINRLALQGGYSDKDSTIISFMTMYELMQYLYELDDRVTYEKYYDLLSDKIKYCRENYRDLIVYDKYKFIRRTEQEMTGYMIDIEKYRKMFDVD